jgi:hypothetical protein
MANPQLVVAKVVTKQVASLALLIKKATAE